MLRSATISYLLEQLTKPFVVLALIFWHLVRMSEKHTHSLPAEVAPSPTGEDYRELAGKIREVAHHVRLPVARRELLHLATNYDRRADQIDRRTDLWEDREAERADRHPIFASFP